jgi:nicotinamidase/pyrazinamidase
VLATQDWHPPEHLSFAVNHPGRAVGELIELNGQPQVLWPVHCVQGTTGADLRGGLERDSIAVVFPKGDDVAMDSYSGFFDNDHQTSTGLGDYLKEKGVHEVYVCGLATDYCVKFTALDAQKLGFETFLIEDASRGVNLRPGDAKQAVEEMRAAGVQVVQSREIA